MDPVTAAGLAATLFTIIGAFLSLASKAKEALDHIANLPSRLYQLEEHLNSWNDLLQSIGICLTSGLDNDILSNLSSLIENTEEVLNEGDSLINSYFNPNEELYPRRKELKALYEKLDNQSKSLHIWLALAQT
jgi:DNA repair ATPase RecN